jgi:hypothetical protein
MDTVGSRGERYIVYSGAAVATLREFSPHVCKSTGEAGRAMGARPHSCAKMKDCRWLKLKLVRQFEFTEWTPHNHLRHSKFVCLREDRSQKKLYVSKRTLDYSAIPVFMGSGRAPVIRISLVIEVPHACDKRSVAL